VRQQKVVPSMLGTNIGRIQDAFSFFLHRQHRFVKSVRKELGGGSDRSDACMCCVLPVEAHLQGGHLHVSGGIAKLKTFPKMSDSNGRQNCEQDNYDGSALDVRCNGPSPKRTPLLR
jgi:hypothetical protein